MRHNNLELISVYWVNANNKVIGFVTAKDVVTGETKKYLGVGKGVDEEADIIAIMSWGRKVTPRKGLQGFFDE